MQKGPHCATVPVVMCRKTEWQFVVACLWSQNETGSLPLNCQYKISLLVFIYESNFEVKWKWDLSLLILSGDQSAMNELMQMRLRSGGTEGLLAEKLEVIYLHASTWNIHYYCAEHEYCCSKPFKSQNRSEQASLGSVGNNTFPGSPLVSK